jgi:hypothetical protein
MSPLSKKGDIVFPDFVFTLLTSVCPVKVYLFESGIKHHKPLNHLLIDIPGNHGFLSSV